MGRTKTNVQEKSELTKTTWSRNSRDYPPQLLQLEAEQPEHEPPVPATGVDSPPTPLEKEAKREKTRLELCLHLGHDALSFDLFAERSNSNLQEHSGHTYSYIGILFSDK